jgi:metal-sulfur cluster biosynthetic enzyme
MDNPMALELPDGGDGAALLRHLAQVLDPELDESITELGFVRSLLLCDGHATVALQLPTGWCAVNFAFMMAEDVRTALLAAKDVRQATVRLGDHCAAAEIEAAVNAGVPFAQAFPGESGGDGDGDGLDALRRTFRRKGFLARQFRLMQALRTAGWSFDAIAALRLGELSAAQDEVVVRTPGASPPAAVAIGPAELLQHYVERRGELGLDCGPAAALIVDPDGETLPPQRLDDYYRMARTVRVSLEANGSFCRAVLATRDFAASAPSNSTTGGGTHVSS